MEKSGADIKARSRAAKQGRSRADFQEGAEAWVSLSGPKVGGDGGRKQREAHQDHRHQGLRGAEASAFFLWSLGRDARRISRMRLGPLESFSALPALACGSGSEADPE